MEGGGVLTNLIIIKKRRPPHIWVQSYKQKSELPKQFRFIFERHLSSHFISLHFSLYGIVLSEDFHALVELLILVILDEGSTDAQAFLL